MATFPVDDFSTSGGHESGDSAFQCCHTIVADSCTDAELLRAVSVLLHQLCIPVLDVFGSLCQARTTILNHSNGSRRQSSNNSWLECFVYVVSNKGTSVIRLPLDTVLLEDRLDAILTRTVSNFCCAQARFCLFDLSVLVNKQKLMKLLSPKWEALQHNGHSQIYRYMN